jgi:hypothetical protein
MAASAAQQQTADPKEISRERKSQMHIFDNVQLSIEEQKHLLETYPDKALQHAIARLRLSKNPIRSVFSFVGKVADDFCRQHNFAMQPPTERNAAASNFQQREMQESPQQSLGYNSAPSRVAGPRGQRPEGNPSRPIGSYSFNQQQVDSWKIKNYPIQQLADEIRGWTKIANSYKNKEATLPPMLHNLFGESGELFAVAKLKELIDEFNKRSPEEQAQAE